MTQAAVAVDGHWMIYQDSGRMLWDALDEGDAPDPGAVGSNWCPVDCATARRFVAEMSSVEAVSEGWRRGHERPPRF